MYLKKTLKLLDGAFLLSNEKHRRNYLYQVIILRPIKSMFEKQKHPAVPQYLLKPADILAHLKPHDIVHRRF